MHSRYHGVVWSKRANRWVARYARDHNQVFVGQFKCQHMAAIELSKAIIDREKEIIRMAMAAMLPENGSHK